MSAHTHRDESGSTKQTRSKREIRSKSSLGVARGLDLSQSKGAGVGHGSAHLSNAVSPSVSKHSFESLYEDSQTKTRSPKGKKMARKLGDVPRVPAFESPLGKMHKCIVRDVRETAPTVQVLAGKVQEIARAVRVSPIYTYMHAYIHT
jgi:hypothetical protein